MRIEIDYFYGCAVCKVDGVLFHKCDERVRRDVRKAVECVTNGLNRK